MSIKPSKITLDFQYGFTADSGGQLKLQAVQASVEGVTDTGTLIRLPLSAYGTEAVIERVTDDLAVTCGNVGNNFSKALEAACEIFHPEDSDAS